MRRRRRRRGCCAQREHWELAAVAEWHRRRWWHRVGIRGLRTRRSSDPSSSRFLVQDNSGDIGANRKWRLGVGSDHSEKRAKETRRTYCHDDDARW
jgi:hypothetical protein